MKEIPLTQGYVALVDDEDYERVNAFSWFITIQKGKNFDRLYARRQIVRNKNQFMHNFILGVVGIDHKNHNGLDNRKGNLRMATDEQNLRNARKRPGKGSPYRGVARSSKNRWRVRIRYDGKSHLVGYFNDELDAATAYNFAAEEHHGEFAIFNTPFASPQTET
jgi:hypothetical protein